MNKQELIKEFREVGIYSLNIFGTEIKAIPTEIAITSIEQLDEPKKVAVPQFVADWITHSKNIGRSLFGAMSIFEENTEIKKWMQWADNQETFALAWILGYEVEEEKRYFVKIKATKHCFARDGNGRIFFSLAYKGCFTKKELEEANFGWVFDCEGIDIEEVE